MIRNFFYHRAFYCPREGAHRKLTCDTTCIPRGLSGENSTEAAGDRNEGFPAAVREA